VKPSNDKFNNARAKEIETRGVHVLPWLEINHDLARHNDNFFS